MADKLCDIISSYACENPNYDFVNEVCLLPDESQFWELHEENSLFLNTFSDHYFCKKSRRSGEADLRMLAKNSKIEEGFVFVEGVARDGTPQSIWYEIGDSYIRDDVPSVKMNFDWDNVARIQKDFDSVSSLTLYHTHPDIYSVFSRWLERFASESDLWFLFGYAMLEEKNPMMPFIDRFDDRVVSYDAVLIMKPDPSFITENFLQLPVYVHYYERMLRYARPTSQAINSIFFSEERRMSDFAQALSSKFLKIQIEIFSE